MFVWFAFWFCPLCLAGLQPDSCFGLPNIQHRVQRAHMTEGFQCVCLCLYFVFVSFYVGDIHNFSFHSFRWYLWIRESFLCLSISCESHCVLMFRCRFWNTCSCVPSAVYSFKYIAKNLNLVGWKGSVVFVCFDIQMQVVKHMGAKSTSCRFVTQVGHRLAHTRIKTVSTKDTAHTSRAHTRIKTWTVSTKDTAPLHIPATPLYQV